jgi:hypothetical protein
MQKEEERMRLWTAMLGAWLAAGSGTAADGSVAPARVGTAAGPLPVPVAEQLAPPEEAPPPAKPPTRAG